jgi:hypothetical protein
MLSISLGPVALPVAPVPLLLAVWGASWLASRFASGGADKGHPTAAGHVVFNAALIGLLAAQLAHLVPLADLYATTPWSALDARDGGLHLPTGAMAGAAWLAWRGWRSPALRRPLAVGGFSGVVFWIAATVATSLGQTKELPTLVFSALDTAAEVSLSQAARGRAGLRRTGLGGPLRHQRGLMRHPCIR